MHLAAPQTLTTWLLLSGLRQVVEVAVLVLLLVDAAAKARLLRGVHRRRRELRARYG